MSVEEIILSLVHKPFSFWMNLFIVAFLFIGVAFLFSKKTPKKLDVKTRNWKRFIYAHYELLQHMNNDEKVEMLKVFDTTVQNAELFSKSSAKLLPKRDKQKLKTKRVTFQL